MKINKINDKKIICNLTERDLCILGFNKHDFFSENDKASAFLSALLDTALEKEEIPEEIEVHQCIITYNDQENSCDVLIHMEKMEEYEDKDMNDAEIIEETGQIEDAFFEEEYQLFKESLEVLLKEESERNPNFLLTFKNINEAIDLCQMVMPETQINSSLLKKDGKYLLVIPKDGLKQEEVVNLRYQMADFIEVGYISSQGLAHLLEYGEAVIKADAISKLKRI